MAEESRDPWYTDYDGFIDNIEADHPQFAEVRQLWDKILKHVPGQNDDDYGLLAHVFHYFHCDPADINESPEETIAKTCADFRKVIKICELRKEIRENGYSVDETAGFMCMHPTKESGYGRVMLTNLVTESLDNMIVKLRKVIDEGRST